MATIQDRTVSASFKKELDKFFLWIKTSNFTINDIVSDSECNFDQIDFSEFIEPQRNKLECFLKYISTNHFIYENGKEIDDLKRITRCFREQKNNIKNKNTPVNNTPVNNTPVNNKNTPVNNTPVKNTPVKNTPVNNTPVIFETNTLPKKVKNKQSNSTQEDLQKSSHAILPPTPPPTPPVTQQKNNKKKEFDIDLDYNSDFIKIDDISLNETDVRIQIDDIFYE